MLDVHAILSLTEPARCHADTMARRELAADLHSLLRLFEDRHGLPAGEGTPAMEMRHGLLRLLRGYEALHGFDQSIPVRRRVREAA